MVFCGLCELIMILGSLYANGWGCVPVLLVICHRVPSTVACWSLSGAGLSVEKEISGRAFAILYYVDPGCLWWSNVLNSALPPQRLRPDTQPEHQDPVRHTAASWISVELAKNVRPLNAFLL